MGVPLENTISIEPIINGEYDLDELLDVYFHKVIERAETTYKKLEAKAAEYAFAVDDEEERKHTVALSRVDTYYRQIYMMQTTLEDAQKAFERALKQKDVTPFNTFRRAWVEAAKLLDSCFSPEAKADNLIDYIESMLEGVEDGDSEED